MSEGRRMRRSHNKERKKMGGPNGRIPVQVPLLGQQQQIRLAHVMQDGQAALPVAVPGAVPLADGTQAVVTFGGLTKLEYLAGMIAGHLAASKDFDGMIVEESMNIAQAILNESKAQQAPSTPKPTA